MPMPILSINITRWRSRSILPGVALVNASLTASRITWALSRSISPLGAISTVPSANWRVVIGRYTAALFLASRGGRRRTSAGTTAGQMGCLAGRPTPRPGAHFRPRSYNNPLVCKLRQVGAERQSSSYGLNVLERSVRGRNVDDSLSGHEYSPYAMERAPAWLTSPHGPRRRP